MMQHLRRHSCQSFKLKQHTKCMIIFTTSTFVYLHCCLVLFCNLILISKACSIWTHCLPPWHLLLVICSKQVLPSIEWSKCHYISWNYSSDQQSFWSCKIEHRIHSFGNNASLNSAFKSVQICSDILEPLTYYRHDCITIKLMKWWVVLPISIKCLGLHKLTLL